MALEALVGQFEPGELNRIGFRFYEHFRPEVPADVQAGVPRARWTCGGFAARRSYAGIWVTR